LEHIFSQLVILSKKNDENDLGEVSDSDKSVYCAILIPIDQQTPLKAHQSAARADLQEAKTDGTTTAREHSVWRYNISDSKSKST